MYVYVYMQTYLQKNSKKMMVGLLPHNHELLYKEIAWAGKIFCTTAEINDYKSCVNHTHCSLHITKTNFKLCSTYRSFLTATVVS